MSTSMGINFAYYLYFDHSRDSWKGLTKENNIENGLNHFLYFGLSRDYWKIFFEDHNSENGLHHAFGYSVL